MHELNDAVAGASKSSDAVAKSRTPADTTRPRAVGENGKSRSRATAREVLQNGGPRRGSKWRNVSGRNN